MKYYPIYLDIKNRNCLVIGGGSVGTRKVLTLLACGAKVTVVSNAATDKLKELSSNGMITLKERPFQTTDLDDRFLVFGATDNQELNFKIHAEAERRGLLCNIADRPKVCNFILPSIVNRGDLIIAISTSGKSPAFAKTLRKHLEKEFGDEYADFLNLMGVIRKKLLSEKHEPEAHKHLFEQLIAANLIEMIREQKTEDINSRLFEILGPGYRYDELTQTSNIRSD